MMDSLTLAALTGSDVFERDQLRREHFDGKHIPRDETCPYCVNEHPSDSGYWPEQV